MKKRLTFRAWIKKTGRMEVARLLGVSPMAVTHWRQGTSCPKIPQMRRIRKLSRGAVTYASIIDGVRKGIRA